MRTVSRALTILVAVLAAGQAVAQAESATLEIATSDGGTPVAARVHLLRDDGTFTNAPKSPWKVKGTPVYAPGLPHFYDHFVIDGRVELKVQPGKYRVTIERGPEYRPENRTLDITAGKRTSLNVELQRWIDMKALGWRSGETHIHRELDDVPLLVKAEDLHVAPVLSVWNERYPWSDRPLPRNPLQEVAPGQWVHWFSTEDERGGGALFLMNQRRPFPLNREGQHYKREFPSPMTFLKKGDAQKVWLDVEKPFWWDMPTWIATGKIDSIGIANNHMNRSQVRDAEAWGKARDTKMFTGVHGNGLYSQHLYYQVLNAGFAIPPSAGSASGVLPNPVGYNRAYVHVGEKFSYKRWWQGLADGRVFVTNGPMLLVEANGKKPGHRFKVRKGKSLTVQLDVRVSGNDPIAAIEVIANGKVVERIDKPGTWIHPKPFELTDTGWFLVRAIADVPHTFRFASTGPFYAQVGSKRRKVHRQSVQFFLDWLDERMDGIRNGKFEKLEGAKLQAVLRPHQQAKKTFQRLLKQAE